MVVVEKDSWVESETADNSAAEPTRAAPSGGLRHFVTGASASFSDTISGAQLVLNDGSTEIARWYVYDHVELSFTSPIRISPGSSVTLSLAASGSGGTIGAANLTGYTL